MKRAKAERLAAPSTTPYCDMLLPLELANQWGLRVFWEEACQRQSTLQALLGLPRMQPDSAPAKHPRLRLGAPGRFTGCGSTQRPQSAEAPRLTSAAWHLRPPRWGSLPTLGRSASLRERSIAADDRDGAHAAHAVQVARLALQLGPCKSPSFKPVSHIRVRPDAASVRCRDQYVLQQRHGAAFIPNTQSLFMSTNTARSSKSSGWCPILSASSISHADWSPVKLTQSPWGCAGHIPPEPSRVDMPSSGSSTSSLMPCTICCCHGKSTRNPPWPAVGWYITVAVGCVSA